MADRPNPKLLMWIAGISVAVIVIVHILGQARANADAATLQAKGTQY